MAVGAWQHIETAFVTRLEKWGSETGVIVDQWLPKIFLLRKATDVNLEVHISTAERGFWGLSPNRLCLLQNDGREWFVALLLRSPESGYLVPSREVEDCTRSGVWPLKRGSQHKIHERTVSEEFHFKSFDELASRLARHIAGGR